MPLYPDKPDIAFAPVSLHHLRHTPFKKRAAGVPAVLSAFRQMIKYMHAADGWKAAAAINQKGGFDCPGCAWPDPDDERSSFEYCENGIKAIAEEAQKKKLTADFFKKHSIEQIGSWSDLEIGKLGRLTEPLILRDNSAYYEPVSWEEAFQIMAGEINGLSSPDEAVYYTSGRTSNEAAFLYQLFVRMTGTNNLPDCSNMCHESSGAALTEVIGVGKGTVTLDDIHHADLLIIMGQNPGTNHPRMLSALEKCKENGGKIIAVNPLPEPGLMNFINPQRPGKILKGTQLADLFLPVRINGDVALLKAIMLLLLEKEKRTPGQVFDLSFIESYTYGFEELLRQLQQQSFRECVAYSGLNEEDIRSAADLIGEKNNIIVCWAMGLTQHQNAVDNIREIVNLLLLRGSIGKPYAGVCPVRGHSNVQGDRTMGIWEKMPEQFLQKLGDIFSFDAPRKTGLDVVGAIRAMHEGKVRVFFALGGNFLSATPDTAYTATALRKTDLTVHVATKLNRSHLVHGKTALILPCLGRTDKDICDGREQFVSTENSMGIVQMSKGVLDPPSPLLLSEISIVCRLAKATFGTKYTVDWDALESNYDCIRDYIEKVIPGFENYNVQVRQPGGFYLPNAVKQRRFHTDVNKAKFSVVPLPSHHLDPGQFLMMTVRSHDQFNTTIYGMNDRYRGIYNERRIIMMNEEDINQHGFATYEAVDIISSYDGEERVAENFRIVPVPIAKGCVASYFPEANCLIPISSVAAISNTPVSKSIIVRLQKRPTS